MCVCVYRTSSLPHLTAVITLFLSPGISRCHQIAQSCLQILHQRCRATSYPNEDHRARRLAVHPCYEWSHFLSRGETVISTLTHFQLSCYLVCRIDFLLLYVQIFPFCSVSFVFWDKIDALWLTVVAQLPMAGNSELCEQSSHEISCFYFCMSLMKSYISYHKKI